MATPLSLSNFLSFLLPSQQPPPPPKSAVPPPNHLSLTTSHQKQKPIEQTNAPILSLQDGPQSSHDISSSLSSVMCPSLAYANTMFFKSAYNVQVIVDENEHEERLLNRFRREVMRAGIIQECKRRRFHENKQDEKKRRTRDAAKRNKKRRFNPRFQQQNKQEETVTKKNDDDDDNWEIPEDSPLAS
ncbi:small ribosomal subunit protein bS21c [Rutidosis leptorrhynchoides]|uniref:small ribosomal subunit protein bS21c n=1 Tax=Rutidosis leptorrhynchoides TaxID=125765 RepID=UPI003A99A9DF